MRRESDSEFQKRATVPVTSRSDAIAATFTNLPEIVLLDESQAPGPPESSIRRPSMWATVIRGLKGTASMFPDATNRPPDIRFGALFQDAARRALSSVRPPALSTAFYETPRIVEEARQDDVPSTLQNGVTRRQAAPVVTRSFLGWYTSGVLAAALAVVSIRSYEAAPKPAPHAEMAMAAPMPAQPAAPEAEIHPLEMALTTAVHRPPPQPAVPAAFPAAAIASVQSAQKPAFEEQTQSARAALQRGELAGAIEHYEAALLSNASYFPAAIGLADTLYAMGKSQQAAVHYRSIIDQYPSSMVPARATELIGQTVASR